MDRLPHVRRYADMDPLTLPRRTNAYDRGQWFANLSNEERAIHRHDPERWWSSVLRRRRAQRIRQLTR